RGLVARGASVAVAGLRFADGLLEVALRLLERAPRVLELARGRVLKLARSGRQIVVFRRLGEHRATSEQARGAKEHRYAANGSRAASISASHHLILRAVPISRGDQ